MTRDDALHHLSREQLRRRIEDNDARSAEVAAVVMRDDHDRIARDLHDHVIQELFALGMGLSNLAAAVPTHSAQIAAYADSLDDVIRAIRTTIFKLQPPRHDQPGIMTQVLGVAAQHADQLGFAAQVRFNGALDVGVGPELAADILAVTREALSNVARHADASTVEITLDLTDGQITLQVSDNGRGLGESTRSSGLANLTERAERNGGTLQLAKRPGGGTRLTWTAQSAPDGSHHSSPILAA
jgi:signal transduction histidine kinase